VHVIDVRLNEPLGPQLQPAVDEIRRGGIVGFPTDTLYGLAADPRSDAAVARLFALKGRERDATVALVASDLAQVERVAEVGAEALALARAFWPGPLTLLLPARQTLAGGVRSPSGLVGVRIPNHEVARALAAACGHAVTATSANPSGASATSQPVEVGRMLPALPVLVNGGNTPGGPPSTIVEVSDGGVRLVREGAVNWERVLESLNAGADRRSPRAARPPA
jgi:L-threonylcarbamoyladenylate synthase